MSMSLHGFTRDFVASYIATGRKTLPIHGAEATLGFQNLYKAIAALTEDRRKKPSESQRFKFIDLRNALAPDRYGVFQNFISELRYRAFWWGGDTVFQRSDILSFQISQAYAQSLVFEIEQDEAGLINSAKEAYIAGLSGRAL